MDSEKGSFKMHEVERKGVGGGGPDRTMESSTLRWRSFIRYPATTARRSAASSVWPVDIFKSQQQ